MDALVFLIPVAMGLGGLGLVAFLWSVHNNQYEDLDGAAVRILLDDDRPIDAREADLAAKAPLASQIPPAAKAEARPHA